MIVESLDGTYKTITPYWPYIVFVEMLDPGGGNVTAKGLHTGRGVMMDYYDDPEVARIVVDRWGRPKIEHKKYGVLRDHRKDLPKTFGYVVELPEDMLLVDAAGGLAVGDLIVFQRYADAGEVISDSWETNEEGLREHRIIVPMNLEAIHAVIYE